MRFIRLFSCQFRPRVWSLQLQFFFQIHQYKYNNTTSTFTKFVMVLECMVLSLFQLLSINKIQYIIIRNDANEKNYKWYLEDYNYQYLFKFLRVIYQGIILITVIYDEFYNTTYYLYQEFHFNKHFHQNN